MKRALLALLLCALASAVLAGSAAARPTVGIADHNVSTFSDPSYRALGVRIARLVIPPTPTSTRSSGACTTTTTSISSARPRRA